MTNRQLFLKASVTSQYVGQIVDRQLRKIGLPGYLLALLTHIRDEAPVSPSAVSKASGVPTTTLRDNVQRLVDRGLVRRVPHPDDGRSYLLVLTKDGHSVTQAAGAALLAAYKELEARLPKPLRHYEAVLDELNEALESVAEPPPHPTATRKRDERMSLRTPV
jgi:DNA-binding MarR family transcriptional regulator